jgi:hypothetical protein
MSRWQELVDDTLRTLESLDYPDRDRIDEAIWDAEKIAEMAELVPLGENTEPAWKSKSSWYLQVRDDKDDSLYRTAIYGKTGRRHRR